MPSKQGDVGLLQDPVALQLLQAKGPAHLAYNWRDGTPRVVPIGFHWNGEEIVMATATDAPKTHGMRNELTASMQWYIDDHHKPFIILVSLLAASWS